MVAICHELGRHCASTAMIYAMHQIQVACIVRHAGTSPWQQAFMQRLVHEQLLLASATTETGVGGDVRSSVCALEERRGSFRLTKQTPVISYAENCDAILATARRTAQSPASDQRLVVIRGPMPSWNSRKTGTRLYAGNLLQWLPAGGGRRYGPGPSGGLCRYLGTDDAAHVAPRWGGLWLGIASEALSRARAFVRAEAKRKPGAPPAGAGRLAQATGELQSMKSDLLSCLHQYEQARTSEDVLSGIPFAVAMNNLKILSSEKLVRIVGQAMLICGLEGYRNDSIFSIGRLLRDAHSAVVMVSNDRIAANNANLGSCCATIRSCWRDGSRRLGYRRFRDELLHHGLLISMGVDGLFGRSGGFERVLEGVNAAIGAVGDVDRPEVMRFPPGIGSLQLEQSGYLRNFPHLAGTVASFSGGDDDHRALLDSLSKGEDWSGRSARPVWRSRRPPVTAPIPSWPRVDDCRRRALLSMSTRGASVTSLRSTRRACRCSGSASMFRIGSPAQIATFRETWLNARGRWSNPSDCRWP